MAMLSEQRGNTPTLAGFLTTEDKNPAEWKEINITDNLILNLLDWLVWSKDPWKAHKNC